MDCHVLQLPGMLNGSRIYLARSLAIRKYVPSVPQHRDAQVSIMSAENFRKLSNRDLSLYISGPLASIESLRTISLPVLVDEIYTRREFLTHKDIFRLVSGLANKNVILNEKLLSVLHEAIKIHSSQFGAHELSNMIVELAACVRRLEREGAKIFPLLASLCDEFGRKIFAATAVDLSHVMMGVADSGFACDSKLVEQIALSSIIQMGTFRGPELCDLLSGFAIMGIKNEDLLAAAYDHICERIHKLLTPQLVDLLFVMARFGFPDDMPYSVKERLETQMCFELEKRTDHLDFKLLDFLISATSTGIIHRIPKSRSHIRSYLVEQKRHDWWYNAPSLSKLIAALEASEICLIGRHIDFVPVEHFNSTNDVLAMLKYLSHMLETEFIKDSDIQYGKALVDWLNRNGVDQARLQAELQDLPCEISSSCESSHGESITGMSPIADDPSRASMAHIVELEGILRKHYDDVKSACRVQHVILDALVTKRDKRVGFMIVPDHDYHVYADDYKRRLKPRVQRQLNRLNAIGIRVVTIDAKDWRNCDRSDLVRNSFSEFI